MSNPVTGDEGNDDLRYKPISAKQFKRAAAASRRSMTELSVLLDVARSQVYVYRDQGVQGPPNRIAHVRRVMALWLRDDAGNPLDGYADVDLVRELERRLHDLHVSVHDQVETSEVDQASTLGGKGRYTGTGGPPDE